MRTIIRGGNVVNEGTVRPLTVVVEDRDIVAVCSDADAVAAACPGDEIIDATGCFVLPGIIDSHVHFREPGLTAKADIESESRAAAAGGVTSFFDMPNTVPQTTTIDALNDKFAIAEKSSHVNYSFFYGATNDNAATFRQLDRSRVPGIKLFMGSSTGNMLVDRADALDDVFRTAAEVCLPVMTHCEDTETINRNMEEARRQYGDDPPIACHPLIRSEQACIDSDVEAIERAERFEVHLHLAHVTTAGEMDMFYWHAKYPQSCQETAEVTVGHLLFCDEDYARLGSRIKVNPAVKTKADRDALRAGLTNGRIDTIATDHAPHLLEQKQGGCARAASGMPMVQFSLVAMLGLVDEGVLPIERMVELMCHNPARIFEVAGRGFLRPGYRADIAIVRPGEPWTLTRDVILSKCGWSPLEGRTFRWQVVRTLCNGQTVYADGRVRDVHAAEAVRFRI